jgi:hypothetical protein
MNKRVLVVSVVFVVLMGGVNLALCQDTSESRLFVIRLTDPGPPAIHSVQAKMSDHPNAVWSSIAANISLSVDGLSLTATVEVPDARWGIFRVERQGTDDGGALSVLEVKTAAANGPVFAVDVAYANAVTNDQLWGETRFLFLGPFAPGKVLVGFQDYVTEEQAIAFFNAGGLRFEPRFPGIFGGVWCRVVSGDPWEHIGRLEERSDIVMWAQWCGRGDAWTWIIVAFNKWATVEAVTELLCSMEGLQPDWESMDPFGGPKYGVVYVPEGHELAWILALEQHPIISYAETSGIVYAQ